jgi:aryl-alcohol dehydrogenase-like predicted oxidoreductase
MYLAATDRYQRMSYARCGRSGLQLPRISLGLWQNFGEDGSFENAREMVLRSFDAGVTHFDLANNYGPPPGTPRGGFTRAAIDVILKTQFGARGFGGRHAPTMSSRQMKEVIQVAHTNVGSVASLGALVGGEVHR